MESELLQSQRRLLVFTAKSLHVAGLESNSLAFFKSAIDMDAHLSPSLQSLFFDVVHALVSPMRQSLRHMHENMVRETRERRAVVAGLVRSVADETFGRLELTCQDILSIIDQQLIPECEDAEARVEFMRLQGDLYRYMFEFATGEAADLYRVRCDSVYESAVNVATSQLPPHSLARLSLVLNRSLFLAENVKRVAEAVEFAETEVSKLLSANTELSEALYQKAMVFARKLRDKIIQWKA